MIVKNIQNVIPDRSSVIVRLLNLDEVYQEVITQSQSSEDFIAVRIGEVISMGPDAQLPIHCPNLKVGDLAIFSQFAGYIVVSTDGQFYKCLRGYDIIGITEDVNEMSSEAVKPTADRVLVEVVDKTESEDGLIIGENARDPRLSDLDYGKILSIGGSVSNKDLCIGAYVAFPTYVGTVIRENVSNDLPELRMIIELDILFHL